MRTIKFRGRHLCGQWYYGNLILRETDSPAPETPKAYKCVMIGEVEDGSEEEVEEETVGQFTGLLDKNNKEIYEGDVVKTKGGWGGIVLWNSRGYFYIKDNNYLDNEEPDLSPIGSLLCCERKRLEIIGNIYDNPELLKGGEEQLQTLHAQLNEGAVTYPEDKRILFTLYEDLMKIMTQEEKQGEQKETNLVEILKHYPRETELYSPLYGKLWLAEVDEKREIITCYKHRLDEGCTRAILEQEDTVSFYSNGTTGLPDFSISKDCMLFLYDIEKQGKQKSIKNIMNVWKDMRLEVYQQASGNRYEPNYSDDTTKMFSLNDIDEIIEKMSEQKPDDKVEIKQKPDIEKGKWYVCNTARYTDFVVGKAYYCPKNGMLKPDENEMARYVARNCFRLWTIQDAKDGDVLASNGNIILFKEISNSARKDYKYIQSHCLVLVNSTNFYTGGSYNLDDRFHPATKEQRDTLMKAISDAGYEWDFEKKELTKIEQSELTEFEEAVKDMIDDYRDAIDADAATTEEVKGVAAYMLSLIPHKPDWSEEDERNLRGIICEIEKNKFNAPEYDMETYDGFLSWLKSLKDRV